MSSSSFKALLIEQGRTARWSAALSRSTAINSTRARVLIRCIIPVSTTGRARAYGRKVIRRFPCVGGIDLSGEVVEKRRRAIQAGRPGYRDELRYRGFASWRLCRIRTHSRSLGGAPARWSGSLRSDGARHRGLHGGAGRGAHGSKRARAREWPGTGHRRDRRVGGLAVDMMSGLGYEVVALTGKPAEEPYLRELGASAIRLRSSRFRHRAAAGDCAVGGCGRQRRRADSSLGAGYHETGRNGREHRQCGRLQYFDHRVPVHSSRCQPSWNRLRLHRFPDSPAGMGSAGRRSQTPASCKGHTDDFPR